MGGADGCGTRQLRERVGGGSTVDRTGDNIPTSAAESVEDIRGGEWKVSWSIVFTKGGVWPFRGRGEQAGRGR